jgi:4-diphosphocytidyl-2-C-methyl-D-erythritol kinase
MIRVFAPAKINLCLHVTGQRGDGYHLLDSIVGFADVGDVLTLQANGQGHITVTGPEAKALAGGPNIISATLAAFGALDIDVILDKHLPVASGIGGGSSDAAAAYRGFCALRARSPHQEDAAQLLPLGADVPMCVAAQPARVQGIGEQITPLPNLARLHAVLANPRAQVATPAVFRALAQKENPPLPPLPQRLDDVGDVLVWLAKQRNDLQPAALTVAPVIAQVLDAISKTGAAVSRMSGSGATCFGLYADQASAAGAAARLRACYPEWWVAQTIINGAIPIAPQVMRATT